MVEISIFKACFKLLQNACELSKNIFWIPGYTPGPYRTDICCIKLILEKSKKKVDFHIFHHLMAKFSKEMLIKSYMGGQKNSIFSKWGSNSKIWNQTILDMWLGYSEPRGFVNTTHRESPIIVFVGIILRPFWSSLKLTEAQSGFYGRNFDFQNMF